MPSENSQRQSQTHNDQTLKDQVKEQHHCYDIKMIISIYMEKQHPEEVGKALLMTSPRECIGGQGLIVRFLLDKSGLVLRLNMIAKLNLTLVRGELDGFFLIDGMCTFQNSIAHLQCHMHQSVNSSQPTVWLGGQGARLAISKAQVQNPAAMLSSATPGKLFTHMCLCQQAV